MTYNRATIMNTAWVIARRTASLYRKPVLSQLSAALKQAWWDAKQAAHIAAQVAQRFAAEAEALARQSMPQLKAALVSLENSSRISPAGWEQINALSLEIRRREGAQRAAA